VACLAARPQRPADPLWVLCTVADPGDVRPAARDAHPDEMTTRWVSARHGLADIALTALPNPAVWRVDENR
jgi:hypothetical protein